jgi:hypothetical protein
MVLIDNANLEFLDRGALSGLWKLEGSRKVVFRGAKGDKDSRSGLSGPPADFP